MAEKEYEILPHEELQKLREEVEELKRNPMGNVNESEDLKTAMGKLTRAMHHLIEILTRTNDEMVSEFKRTTMSEHFQKISDQNEKIATALLGMTALQEHPAPAPSQFDQDNVPGMKQESTPAFSAGVDAPLSQPEHQPASGIIEPAPASLNEASGEQPLPGLDIPPPQHHKKGLSGLFKK